MGITYMDIKEREKAFKAAFPRDNGDTIVVNDPVIIAAIHDYLEMQQIEKAAAEAKALAGLIVKERMRSAAIMKAGPYKVTFKATDVKEHVVSAQVRRSVNFKKVETPE